MQKLILIRGLPGSGKSTLARALGHRHWFEADDMYTNPNNNEYVYEPRLLDAAHSLCFGRAVYYLKQGDTVVVSNTFTQEWELEKYILASDVLGVPVKIIECTAAHGSIHAVPKDKMKAFAARWVSNEKLKQQWGKLFPNVTYETYDGKKPYVKNAVEPTTLKEAYNDGK